MSIIKGSHGSGIEICYSWRRTSDGDIPPGTLRAGENTYVMRAHHEGGYTPGKLVEGHSNGYIPYGGEEVQKEHYEALVETCIGDFDGANFTWKEASNGEVPKYAIIAGADEGRPLFIARGWIDDECVVGKMLPEHGCAYFPWGGEEHKREEYQILCANKIHV